MSNDDYVKPPRDSVFKNAAGAVKGAYAYLHPDYWKRKLIHLVIVAPAAFLFYGTVYGLIFMKLTGMTKDTIPWILETALGAVIIATTAVCAYFYPFALWWYRQSFTGTTLNDMVYVGKATDIVFRKMMTQLFGVIIAGLMAPVTGPLALRKCRKKNMVIGEACDFE